MGENDSVETVVIARSDVETFKFVLIVVDGATVNSRDAVFNVHKRSSS